MSSALVSAVRPLVAQFAIATEVDQDVGPTVRWLSTFDQIIFGVSAVVILAGAAWWLWGGRADPLRACPARPNRPLDTVKLENTWRADIAHGTDESLLKDISNIPASDAVDFAAVQ